MIAPTPLTPSLWVSQSDDFLTNAGVFISQGQTLLVDPGMRPEEINGISRALHEHGAEPRWLVLTHGHWDHILGPERFPGVPVVAHAAYGQTVAAEASYTQWAIARWAKANGAPRAEPFAVPGPNLTFEGELALELGALRLRLAHAPGHAADQLTLYEPESGTLWAADMLSDVEIPYIEHSLDAYERTLERLASAEVRVLVPGHGHPTTSPAEIRARLDEDRAYLAELRQRVAQAVQRGQTAAAAVAACAAMRLREPDVNTGAHGRNVETTYLELGGVGDPDRLGWRGLVVELMRQPDNEKGTPP